MPRLISSFSGLFLESVFLFILPFFLIYRFPFLLHLRLFIILIYGFSYATLISHFARFSWEKMGFSLKNFFPALQALLLPTLFIAFLSLTAIFLHPSFFSIPILHQEISLISFPNAVLAYVFISVPTQEILFRGFYLPRLELVFSRQVFSLLYSTLIFMFIHIPLGSWLLVIFTGIMGFIWGQNFFRFRSLPALMISHAALGIFLIYLNAFSF